MNKQRYIHDNKMSDTGKLKYSPQILYSVLKFTYYSSLTNTIRKQVSGNMNKIKYIYKNKLTFML